MPEGSTRGKPDYGIDAPKVVRNLLIVSAVGLAVWITAALRLWSGRISIGAGAGGDGGVNLVVAPMGLSLGLGCAAMGLWMLWSSKVGKIRERERLLDRIEWSGSERVLDIGCGRGLMLVGAAKRLESGHAIGIDIWQSEDLSGNRPESTLENARREGVADRVRVQTADMRRLPFDDASFDVVLSCAAIHNLYAAADREKAICEIARVLRPGGQAVIDDIRHHTEYARTFARAGCTDVQRVGSRILAAVLPFVTMGSLRPQTLLVRKTA